MAGLSLRWRLIALVLASVLTAQAIGFGVLLLAPPPEPPRMSIDAVVRVLQTPGEAATGDGLDRREVESLPPRFAGRARGTAQLMETLLRGALAAAEVRVRMVGDGSRPEGPPRGAAPSRTSVTVMRADQASALVQSLSAPSSAQALLRSTPYPPFEAAVRGHDGRWTIVGPERPLLSPWQVRVLAAFALSALVLTPAAWWSARRLTRPMTLFAEAAERLGLDPGAEPLPLSGPEEVRTAAASFNRMQERLKTYVEGRTAMVAAIAHDLRTPLTGLRVRAEAAPAAERARMVEDIGRMEAMIAQVLAFVRGEQVREPRERVDLRDLAAACIGEAVERGECASLGVAAALPVLGEPLNLRRAVANLIANAVNYGGAARITVAASDGCAVLTVEDDGPGLPPDSLETVFEPFRRLEPSRSRSTGGVGLGLATALGVVRAHKGSLTLRNRPEGGLAAEMRLPLAG